MHSCHFTAAGLPIGALEKEDHDSDGEEDEVNDVDEGEDSSDDDDKFVVSDSEMVEQSADLEVNCCMWQQCIWYTSVIPSLVGFYS